MIVCDRHDWARERYAFHPVIDQAIEWIATTDFAQLTLGKYDILPDGKMFCLLQEMETVAPNDMRAESHFDYVDIQYLLSGREVIGVARSNPEDILVEDRRPNNDIVFYNSTINESMIALEPGMFAVFFPHDVHRPCCHLSSPAKIRKAVIKIHLNLFVEG